MNSGSMNKKLEKKAKIKILVALLYLILAIRTHNETRKCILKALVEGFELNKEHYKAMQSYLNEEDFNNTVIVSKETLYDILDLEDMSLNQDLQQMISVTVKSDIFKTALLKCRPDANLPKLRCEAYYGEGNCQMLDEYVWAKKCPYGYKGVGLEYCVPNCPSGFADIEEDPFYCQKTFEIQRSKEFYDRKTNPPLKFMNYRGLISPMCPDGFDVTGVDFCSSGCPIGWGNLGIVCQKPMIIRRKHEIFSYSFLIDDYLMQEVLKKDNEELGKFTHL